MIKLYGNKLKNAMMFNFLKFENKKMTIHNTDGDGYGIITTEICECDEEMEFCLSKKDYSMLSNLEEVEISLSKNVIQIKSSSGVIKLSNLTNTAPAVPDSNNFKLLDIKPSSILQGRKFVGNDKLKQQLNGVTISSDAMMITDSHQFYIMNEQTGISSNICIPKEVFNYLKDMEMVYADDKAAAFVNGAGNKLLYTSLISQPLKVPKLPTDTPVVLDVNKDQLISQLKIIKEYSDIVSLKTVNDTLHLLATNETNNFDLLVETKWVKGKKLNVTLKADHMLHIFELEKDDVIQLSFANNMMLYRNENIVAGDMYFAQHDEREVI